MGTTITQADLNSKKYIQTNDGSVYKKNSTGTVIGSILAATLAGDAVETLIKPDKYLPKSIKKYSLHNHVVKNFLQYASRLWQRDNLNNQNIENAMMSMYKESKIFKQRGIKIFNYENLYKVPDGAMESVLKHPRMKILKIFPKIYNHQIKRIENMLSRQIPLSGQASHITDSVHISMVGKMRFALPHELGHALNYTSKGLPKIINSCYKSTKALVPAVLLTAILRRKKADGEESKTFAGKALDFVKNNCVGITAALCAPTLIEEASASIRGIKMMKGYLPKPEMNMLRGFLGRAWLTYAVGTAAAIGTVWAANKVKNLIDKPKKLELTQVNQTEAIQNNTIKMDLEA